MNASSSSSSSSSLHVRNASGITHTSASGTTYTSASGTSISTSRNINNNESATRRYISKNGNINTRNDNVNGGSGGSRTSRPSSAKTPIHTQTQNDFKLVRDHDVVIHLSI
eukprot:472423_1